MDHPSGPLKVGPTLNGTAPAQTDHFTSIPLRDAHRFLDDIAAMYEGEALTLADKLIGAAFLEDRTIYCARRSEPIPGLDAVRAIPFVIEIIKNQTTSFLNVLPVAEVRKVGEATYYGLTYGDIKIDYLFADR